jgi:hypothetical protein
MAALAAVAAMAVAAMPVAAMPVAPQVRAQRQEQPIQAVVVVVAGGVTALERQAAPASSSFAIQSNQP